MIEFLAGLIVCPDCGNKRCPKASNHRHQCTGSNEPNQRGSIYTTPQTKPLSDEEINLLKAEIAAHKKTNELLSKKIIELERHNKK